jgi:hypothetical protein
VTVHHHYIQEAQPMRHLIVGIVGLMFMMASYCAAQSTRTFTGEIIDEDLNCAQTPMKAPPDVKTKLECILHWTYWYGKRYVLYDAATKTTYQLADQDKVIPFIGAKVLITGTESNNTIKVTDIKADEVRTKGTDDHKAAS